MLLKSLQVVIKSGPPSSSAASEMADQAAASPGFWGLGEHLITRLVGRLSPMPQERPGSTTREPRSRQDSETELS